MNRTLFATLIVASFIPRAYAWNTLGHKVVAEIAWQQLDPTTRQSIVDVLRRHPRFDTDFAGKMEDNAQKGDKAVQDHWIFQNAATWPDEIRKNKEYDRPTWHYINLPLFVDPSDRTAMAGRSLSNLSAEYPTKLDNHKYNIIQALAWARHTIGSNAPADVKAIAFCWLLHLVGDIHQPLHSSALYSVNQFPKGDEGGNKILLRKGKNLHSLWDGLLGKQYYMRNVDKVVAELKDKERFGNVWDTAATETDPKEWAKESRNLCEAMVYDDAIRAAVRNSAAGEKMTPIDLPVEYYQAAGEQARKRLLAARLRLGALLKTTGEHAE
jgi:hypothetical protein